MIYHKYRRANGKEYVALELVPAESFENRERKLERSVEHPASDYLLKPALCAERI